MLMLERAPEEILLPLPPRLVGVPLLDNVLSVSVSVTSPFIPPVSVETYECPLSRVRCQIFFDCDRLSTIAIWLAEIQNTKLKFYRISQNN